MDKVKVLDGRDFGLRWNGCFITLEDYENITYGKYEQEIWDLLEYNSFEFDEYKHEVWEIE